ncbi:cohesin subunit SA 1 [Echinococcus multilocularis]|uniref:Cohesin subunit SA 1 n=1 Tax=Echinococcus multilocularis TaxID=6211 RepID=A0A068Y5W2_ECHMU|nr:cohesin subunit SA 1 [Echinococcus multilocularis]
MDDCAILSNSINMAASLDVDLQVMMNQYPQQSAHSNSSGQRYIGQNSQEHTLQRPINAADFEQHSINSLQGHHAQPVADIPVGIFNQPENTHPSFHTPHHYYPPYSQNRSPQNREDVELTSFYGAMPISEKYNPTSAVPQQPQFPGTTENLNGPKDPNSTSGPPPNKKKRGRPALFPSSDNDVGRGVLPEDEEHTLFGAIRSGRASPQTLVDDWIEQYKTGRAPAMLELVQFFISCSGCKGKVSLDMYNTLPHADIIKRMTEEFDEDSGEYPLVQSSPTWRRFRSNFVEFIQVLIRQCQYSIIYDQCMVDQIVSLLTGLSDSPVRAFRHTSTLAAMKMMTALVDVALNVSINRDNTQRQYEGERARGGGSGASSSRRSGAGNDRLDVLMSRRQELEENMKEVKDMLILLFKGIFIHRYRDSQPEIRAICIAEIGVWMRRYPAMFLDDSYLKYIGWTLYDRVGEVRLQCLRALQPLYDDPTFVSNLSLFTSRFKKRLVDMTLDKELDVAVQAVKVVSCILKHAESKLEDKDCENIYELVYCTHRPLAQAAGEFLTLKLFEVDANAPITRTRKGKKRSENTPLLRDLVQFFIESELHEHAAYLVDSLWEIAPMLRDWEAMIDLLIEEPGKNEEPLDASQESSLIEIMVCCVQQAATGESPVGRQSGSHSSSAVVLGAGETAVPRVGRGGVLSAREAKALAEARARMTEAMIPALHPLLTRFGESAERATSLLQIPRYMDLEIYTTGRHQRHLDLLLQCVERVVERHTDPETLLACSRAYEVLCQDDLSIAANCQTVRGTLFDRLTDLYRRAFLSYFNEQGDEPDDDDEFHLVSALKRIYAFYSCHDLNGLGLWQSLIRIVSYAPEEASPEIIAQAIACCAKSLFWRLAHVSEPDPSKDEVDELRQMLDNYMRLCTKWVGNANKRIASEAYLSLCDLLVAFSRHLDATEPSIKSLAYVPDPATETGLIRFLETFVFVDDEEDENLKFEALHERRIQLAGFCKLVVYNLLPIKSAAPLYRHYIRFHGEFGDIMKSTLGKLREINRVHTAKMIVYCLQLGFSELQAACQGSSLERASDGFQALRELARRLNLSFGLDLIKIREAMVAFHSDGIQFVLSTTAPATNTTAGDTHSVPTGLLFFEIMAEFSNKLLQQDKRSISSYTFRIFPQASGEEWASLQAYRTSLDPDASDHHPLNTSSQNIASGSVGPSGRGRGRPRRPRPDDVIDPEAAQFVTGTTIKRRKGNSEDLFTSGTASPARRPGRPPGSNKRQATTPVMPPAMAPVGH